MAILVSAFEEIPSLPAVYHCSDVTLVQVKLITSLTRQDQIANLMPTYQERVYYYSRLARMYKVIMHTVPAPNA